MIKSIELKNIQSHENTRLEFDKGINCIVGSSNNGKSAILRGLYWARYNRPLGVDTLASHWALNKKGELTDEMSVTIENENGIICRKRARGENQYIVDDEILNVVKSDVPAKVEQVLRLSDTNVQRQLDAPFLLSETSGEVAKYFNHIVRLDIIDKVLTNAESSRRRTKSDIDATEKIIKEQEQKKEKYNWLDSVERLLRKWDNVKAVNDELNIKSAELGSQLATFLENGQKVDKFADIVAQKEKLKNISTLYEKVARIDDLCGDLTNSIATYKELLSKVEKLSKAVKLKKFIVEIEKLSREVIEKNNLIQIVEDNLEKYNELSSKKNIDFSKQKKLVERLQRNEDNLIADIKRIEESIYNYKIQKTHIENSASDIKCLKEQLPAICPLCGNLMKNGVCKNGD